MGCKMSQLANTSRYLIDISRYIDISIKTKSIRYRNHVQINIVIFDNIVISPKLNRVNTYIKTNHYPSSCISRSDVYNTSVDVLVHDMWTKSCTHGTVFDKEGVTLIMPHGQNMVIITNDIWCACMGGSNFKKKVEIFKPWLLWTSPRSLADSTE